MRFSTKILLGFLGLSFAGAASVCWLSVRSANQSAQHEYFLHYESLGRSLAATFTELERATDSTVLNAERVFATLEAHQGMPNPEQMLELAKSLQVSTLGTFDANGISEYFTNAPSNSGKGAVDLFAMCGEYRVMLEEGRPAMVLPFTPKVWANDFGHVPEKYVLGPSADRKHVLAATLLNSNLDGFLREAISVNPSLLRAALTTQDGAALATAEVPEAAHTKAMPISGTEDLSNLQADAAMLTFKVISSVPYCCECFTKGSLKDPYDTSYRLNISVSLKPLQAAARTRRNEALGILAAVGLTCAVLGRWVARRLVLRIERLSATTQQVLQTGDLSVRAEGDTGDDEMAVLTRGFNMMMRTLNENESFRAEQASAQAIAKVAAQAAHDIRSPVAALHMLASYGRGMPEEQRLLMRDAVRRINDIANNLLTKHRIHAVPGAAGKELISPLVQSALSEQRAVRAQRDIQFVFESTAEGHEAFCSVEPLLFRRVLSNLLNNASEAIEGSGEVRVDLRCGDDDLELSIIDTGRGIPKHLQAQVLAGGKSHGKSDGNGMGLASAAEAMATWDGSLELESDTGRGTTVLLRLPLQAAASWFAHALHLDLQREVYVLDDDAAMGRVWQQRLGRLGFAVRVFRTSETFSEAVAKAGSRVGACLVDYELLGDHRSGLDVVRDLSIENKSFLVTSYYDEESVREGCLNLGMRIVPKAFAAHVPIIQTSG